MKAEILTIGDELIIGQVINTNAAWLGEQLSLAGIDVVRMRTLGDDLPAIEAAIQAARAEVDLLIITGGLGPTHDDVTKTAVASFFGTRLAFHAPTYERVRARFASRGLSMPESNRSQAMVPDGFEVLDNPVGTAPGLWRVEGSGSRPWVVVILPGVPYEMKELMQRTVLPRLARHGGRRIIRHRTLLTTGIGESNLQERLGDLSAYLSEALRLAYLPSTSGVRLRLTALGGDAAEADHRLDVFETYLRSRIEAFIFSTGQDTLEAAVGRMLAARGLTVAVAESCTGGLVLNRLTNVSGASAYVLGGVVAYCNNVKERALGVEAAVLEAHGAVSETVALQMAQGVRTRLGADIGVSTTGIMGPTGGTPTKPVGLVWIGYAEAGLEKAWCVQFAQDRQTNKALASTAALNRIRLQLLGRAEAGLRPG